MEGSNRKVAKSPPEPTPSGLKAMAARTDDPEGPQGAVTVGVSSGSRSGAQPSDALPCFLLGKTREPESQASRRIRSRYVGA